MAHQTDAAELSDDEVLERIEHLRGPVEDGTVPPWTADEPLADYLTRVRAIAR